MNEKIVTSKETAWNYALGMIKVDGLTPSDEMLEMIEMEKRGEITTDEIIKRLDEKYSSMKEFSTQNARY